MKIILSITFVLSSLCHLAIAENDASRYCNPWIPPSGAKVLLGKEFIIGPEKVFMTFWTNQSVWDSLPVVDLEDKESFTFTYNDAFKRALAFRGDNPPKDIKPTQKPLSSKLVSIERITVMENNDLKHPKGRYYYYAHIHQVFPSPSADLPEQPIDTKVIVLPNGWAAYPEFQFMKIKE